MKVRHNRKRSASEKAVRHKDAHKMRTISWLKERYCVDTKAGNILKCKVYEEYTRMCEEEEVVPVNPAVFGKILHTAFPTVENVRLMRGNNGQCKYYYRHFRLRGLTSRTSSGDGINAITTRLSESCGLQSPAKSPRSVLIKTEDASGAEELTSMNDDVSQLIKSLGEDDVDVDADPDIGFRDQLWDSSLRRTRSSPCYSTASVVTTPPIKRRASFVFGDQNRAYKQRSSSPESFPCASSSSSSSPHSSRPSSPAKELFPPQQGFIHQPFLAYQQPSLSTIFWDMHTEFENSLIDACIDMGTLARYRVRDVIYSFWGSRIRQVFSLPPVSDISQFVEPKVSPFFYTGEFMQESIRRDKDLYARIISCFAPNVAGSGLDDVTFFEGFIRDFGSAFVGWLWRCIRDILPQAVLDAKMNEANLFAAELISTITWSSTQHQQHPLFPPQVPQFHPQHPLQQQQQQLGGPYGPTHSFYKLPNTPAGSYTTTTAISNDSILSLPPPIPFSPLTGMLEAPNSNDFTSALFGSWPFGNGDADNGLFTSCPLP